MSKQEEDQEDDDVHVIVFLAKRSYEDTFKERKRLTTR
jgi:hypothetical protein